MSDIRIKQHPTLGILVCTDGHVMVPANKTRKPHWTTGSNHRGYRFVKINSKSYSVHRLVAETFIPNPNNLPEVDHYPDRTTSNNSVTNLRWADRTTQNRNTRKVDKVSERGWTHTFENKQEYNHAYNVAIREKHRQYQKDYYATHKDKCVGAAMKYYKAHRDQELLKSRNRSKTHKHVKFANGSRHWIINEKAVELLKLPVNMRVFT